MDRETFFKENWFSDYNFLLKDGRLLEGWFSDTRVDKSTVPDGLYAYDCREDDNWGWPATIENHNVIVNHAGVFVTETPIDFGGQEYLEIDNSDLEPDIYQWMYGYSDTELMGYEIVCWPESQDCMEIADFYHHAYLINDDEGLEKYGSSAYVVEKSWLEEHQ